MRNMSCQKCRKNHAIEKFSENNTEHDDKCLNGSNFPIPKGMTPTYELTPDPLPCNPNLISRNKPLEATISPSVLKGYVNQMRQKTSPKV